MKRLFFCSVPIIAFLFILLVLSCSNSKDSVGPASVNVESIDLLNPPDTIFGDPADTIVWDSVYNDTIDWDTIGWDTLPWDTSDGDTIYWDTIDWDTIGWDTLPWDTVGYDTIIQDT